MSDRQDVSVAAPRGGSNRLAVLLTLCPWIMLPMASSAFTLRPPLFGTTRTTHPTTTTTTTTETDISRTRLDLIVREFQDDLQEHTDILSLPIQEIMDGDPLSFLGHKESDMMALLDTLTANAHQKSEWNFHKLSGIGHMFSTAAILGTGLATHFSALPDHLVAHLFLFTTLLQSLSAARMVWRDQSNSNHSNHSNHQGLEMIRNALGASSTAVFAISAPSSLFDHALVSQIDQTFAITKGVMGLIGCVFVLMQSQQLGQDQESKNKPHLSFLGHDALSLWSEWAGHALTNVLTGFIYILMQSQEEGEDDDTVQENIHGSRPWGDWVGYILPNVLALVNLLGDLDIQQAGRMANPIVSFYTLAITSAGISYESFLQTLRDKNLISKDAENWGNAMIDILVSSVEDRATTSLCR